jgi:hypothetical protein
MPSPALARCRGMLIVVGSDQVVNNCSSVVIASLTLTRLCTSASLRKIGPSSRAFVFALGLEPIFVAVFMPGLLFAATLVFVLVRFVFILVLVFASNLAFIIMSGMRYEED